MNSRNLKDKDQLELINRFKNISDKWQFTNNQMAELLSVTYGTYSQKINPKGRLSFDSKEEQLLYFWERYGIPEHIEVTPAKRLPNGVRQKEREEMETEAA